jgi:hypothetical protein
MSWLIILFDNELWRQTEAMETAMTIEGIQSRFDSEWVLVENPRTNEALEVLSGHVLHHSKDRDEVYRKAVALRPERCAVLYTGEIPEGTAVVL